MGVEPTIRTVAARAGVSKSLVSLVLQDSPKVSPARRAAVLAAIVELGYRPHAAARTLSRRHPGAVGVLVNDLRNPWFVRCLEGLTAGLGASGLGVLVGDRRLDDRQAEPMLNLFIDMRLDGLVLMGTMPGSPTIQTAAARLPTVMVGHRDFDLPYADMSAQDDMAGARLAVEHLLALGHRHIAHIAGETGQAALTRRGVYESVMAEHGLDAQISIESCDLSEESGFIAAGRLLDAAVPPTAIFAVNDVACIGALGAARDRGVDVPGSLSLVGYDNTPFAASRQLRLTTIDYDVCQVGERAARMLLQRIERPDAEPQDFRAGTSLIRGSTTAAPRAAVEDRAPDVS